MLYYQINSYPVNANNLLKAIKILYSYITSVEKNMPNHANAC
jgi:hypothetical protein